MPKRQMNSKGPSQRQLRAGELVRHTLVEILRREDFSSHGLDNQAVTVTEVRCSPDLRSANVYCTALGGENVNNLIKLLNRLAPKLRGDLGRKIEMKFTPELRFKEDTSFDEAERIDAILSKKEVQRDLAGDDH